MTVQLSRAEKIASRAAAMERLGRLLAQEPMTADELSKALGVGSSTVASYLHEMWREQRTVRKTGRRKGRRELWEVGADLLLPTRDQGGDPQRGSVPAQQCGMWRDPLVSALFGPPGTSTASLTTTRASA